MGVSGCGKSTVGAALATLLGVPFADGDSFHSPANVAKMSAGIPLDDTDRWPWLDAIGAWAAKHEDAGAVIACSALTRRYRDRLRAAGGPLMFLHLDAAMPVIEKRVGARGDHFMPTSLVQSQFQALEPLAMDEPGITMSANLTVEQLTEDALVAVLIDTEDLAHRSDQ
jgi:gluconokinase